MTITCDIQPTNVVAMVIKVLHNSCNICTLDLTDMHALALVLVHTYQSNHLHTCYNHNMYQEYSIMYSLWSVISAKII